jgi:hypothetical protein
LGLVTTSSTKCKCKPRNVEPCVAHTQAPHSVQ